MSKLICYCCGNTARSNASIGQCSRCHSPMVINYNYEKNKKRRNPKEEPDVIYMDIHKLRSWFRNFYFKFRSDAYLRKVIVKMVLDLVVKAGIKDERLLQMIMFKVTRDIPELQRVLPFYWYINGPTSDLLDEILVELDTYGVYDLLKLPKFYDGRWDSYQLIIYE